jgi:hypothetical protein
MPDRVSQALARWLPILGAVIAIVFAWAKLEGQVAALDTHKADRSELTALRGEVQAMRRVMEDEFRIQRIILCDNARVKSDTYCRTVERTTR